MKQPPGLCNPAANETTRLLRQFIVFQTYVCMFSGLINEKWTEKQSWRKRRKDQTSGDRNTKVRWAESQFSKAGEPVSASVTVCFPAEAPVHFRVFSVFNFLYSSTPEDKDVAPGSQDLRSWLTAVLWHDFQRYERQPRSKAPQLDLAEVNTPLIPF